MTVKIMKRIRATLHPMSLLEFAHGPSEFPDFDSAIKFICGLNAEEHVRYIRPHIIALHGPNDEVQYL